MLATLQMRDAELGSNSLSDDERAALVEKLREAQQDESLTEAQRLQLKLQELRQTDDPVLVKNKLKQMINAAPDSFEMWQMLINLADDEQEAAKFFQMMKSKVDGEQYGASMALLKIQIAMKHAPDSFPDRSSSRSKTASSNSKSTNSCRCCIRWANWDLHVNQRELGIRLLEKTFSAPSANPAVKTEILNILFEDALTQSNVDQINTVIDRIRRSGRRGR